MPFTREYIDTNDNIFQNASTITKASKIFHSYYKINSSRHHNTNYQAEFKGKTFKEVCAHLNAALLVTYKAHGIRPLKNSSPSVLIASTRTKIDPKINREMLPHPIWKHIKGTQSYLINQKAHELWNVLRMDSFYKQLSDEDYRTMNPAKKNCKL